MSEEADVIVVGMGPGGEEIGERLAERRLDVLGIESDLLGGECPYWGCIPSKMMIRAANLLAEARRIPGMSGASSVDPDWEPVARRIREEATDDWNDQVAVDRFVQKGGRFVRGHGRLVGPNEVAVDDRRFSARRGVVIATGARSWTPPIPGLSELAYWTNRDAIEVKDLPQSLAIIGGGAIAVELGQVFARFGVEVTILEAAPRLLPVEDPEASALIEEVFHRDGITVITGAEITGASHRDGGFSVALSNHDDVVADRLLVAAGRRPDLSSLGLETVGLDGSARFLAVDSHLRAAPGIWAVGDVTGVGAFTHIAMYQASIVIADILGESVSEADYRAVPRVTFTDPEIGSVGLSEAEARSKGIAVRVATSPVSGSARGWIHKAGNEGFVKLIEDSQAGVLIGAVSAGPTGGEVLSMLTLAIHARIPIVQLRTMIYAYPTFHRTVEAALSELHA